MSNLQKKDMLSKVKAVCNRLCEVEKAIESGKLDSALLLEYQHEEKYLNQLLEDILENRS